METANPVLVAEKSDERVCASCGRTVDVVCLCVCCGRPQPAGEYSNDGTWVHEKTGAGECEPSDVAVIAAIWVARSREEARS